MPDLQKLLEEQHVRTAVIIDDVFDEYPRADELDAEDWTIFFDDLGEEGGRLLAELIPDYETTSSEDLQISPEFIKTVWDNRGNLPDAACEPLFADYEATRDSERSSLEELAEKLGKCGLACSKMGSDVDDSAKEADLIFVDLFLGFKQTEDDMGRAIDRISALVHDRMDRPPLVVLMSRSSRLMSKRNDFRDRAGLLGSTFRVIGKVELEKDGSLETLIDRLVTPYEDAKRIAAFLKAWDDGLDKARKSFVHRLRRLDLSDLAQIRTLLLDFEGQSLGEYLLDVADRVLQHEIEGNPGTISAALELNKVDPGKYPAPHLEGTADLQELVHSMIFQHVERLKLSGDPEPNVLQFGDILRCKTAGTDDLNENVLVILSPACDLLRCSVENILMLPGSLKTFGAADWSYGNTTAKIPIFVNADGTRHWIKWDIKGYQTIPTKDVLAGLEGSKGFVRIGRLREVCGIELQQRVLSEIGRIGQTANPPATFQVSIEMYSIPSAGPPQPIDIPGLKNAVCFVGRDEHAKRVDHLVLTETSCDALRETLLERPKDDIHPSAHASLDALHSDLDFFSLFERGMIELPTNPNSPKPYKNKDNQIYMNFLRNQWDKEGDAVSGDLRKAPFVMKVSDLIEAND